MYLLEIKPLPSFAVEGPHGNSIVAWNYFPTSTLKLFEIMIYIRSIKDYYSNKSNENPDGTKRVLVTFQSFAGGGVSALFAGQLPDDAKIGSMTLQKGITLEQATKALALGQDMSATHSWGALKEGTYNGEPNKVLHEVKLGASTPTKE